MILRIQDPGYPTVPSLHETLLEACEGAIRGGGAFAFVSQGGVELLLNDKVFTDFAAKGQFDLVVGIDEITNLKSLAALDATKQEHSGLTVRVFHHDLPNTIFHPKFCWFRNKSGGALITGSGNLTVRGLRRNWEAFTVSDLSPKEIDEVEQQWAEWTKSHTNWLKATDDEQVLARAARNVFRPVPRGTGETRAARTEEEPDVDDIAAGSSLADDAVLVAEIPQSGNRWNQANFTKNDFRNFFGATEGAVQRILLQHVNADGTPGQLESRPSVSVISKNFRFELGAAAGLNYPKSGRPIGVFVRVATRTFKYRLLMPADPDYNLVFKFLKSEFKGRADRMRRVTTTTSALRQAWPTSPLWLTP